MKFCDCGAPNHTLYDDSYSEAKDTYFNSPMADRVFDLLKANPDTKFQYWVMDADNAWSSHKLLSIGVDPRDITAFTYCGYAFDNLNSNKAKFNKRHCSAEKLYCEPQFSSGAHIVIDDGTNAYIKTLERLELLISMGCDHLVIMSNICTRGFPGNSGNQKEKFQKGMVALAEKYDYNILKDGIIMTQDEINKAYSRGIGKNRGRGAKMAPFWFEFKKKEYKPIEYIVIESDDEQEMDQGQPQPQSQAQSQAQGLGSNLRSDLEPILEFKLESNWWKFW